MVERIIVVLLMYTVLFSYDLSRLKKQQKKARYIYTIIVALSLYVGLDFIFEADWPNIIDLVNVVFLKPAELIIEYLKK
jgi:Kef-type K+ transport system membrane component KefB